MSFQVRNETKMALYNIKMLEHKLYELKAKKSAEEFELDTLKVKVNTTRTILLNLNDEIQMVEELIIKQNTEV